jgi:hypothetical protein
MGMQIYVQKLSNPLEEWELDVESSDTIEGVKSKVIDNELPVVYELLKIHLFKDATELLNGNTLSDYNIQKNSHLTSSYDASNCDPIFDKFANGNEDGCSRFRRLWLLGYV